MNDPRMSVLLWGDPGSGKTTLAGSLVNHPSISKALFIDVEGGYVSIPPENRSKLVIKGIAGKSDLENLYWEVARGAIPVQAVIIDSGTELQQDLLSELAPSDNIELRQYGQNTTTLRRIFRWFRRLDVHLVITALAKEEKNSSGVVTSVRPFFTDRLASSICGYMSHVWHTYQQGGKYYLLTKDERGLYATKTRGQHFSRHLPQVVPLADPLDDKSDGHTLATLLDLYIKMEGGNELLEEQE